MFLARRQCKTLTTPVLGVWLFTLAAGVANACIPGEPPTAHPASSVALVAPQPDESASPNCAQFCNDATPLFAKLQRVQDQPAGKSMLVALPVVSWPADFGNRVATTVVLQPPPDVPVLFRSHRLTL